jgi:hypothetical protein
MNGSKEGRREGRTKVKKAGWDEGRKKGSK